MKSIRLFLITIILGTAFGVVNAQNTSCFSPGTLIAEGAPNASLAPSAAISSVHLAEPLNGDEAQTLQFTMKVASLESLPTGTWDVVFTPEDGETRFVQMSTMSGKPVFLYGMAGNIQDTPVYTVRGSAVGSYTNDGHITISVDKTVVGKPSLGTFLQIEARTSLMIAGVGLVPQDSTKLMSYQVQGNSDCPRTLHAAFGTGDDIPMPYSFSQFRAADLGVWQPATGDWRMYNPRTGQSGNQKLGSGAEGDIPMIGDYDKDNFGDPVVYRPLQGDWFIQSSVTGSPIQARFGIAEDLPVVGDFDGDKVDDITVFRPSSGVWYTYNSSDATVSIYPFGTSGDVPAAADYDGDGKSDVAVFRPSTGAWFVFNSSDASVTMANFGIKGDKAVPADYDGDGKADIAVRRPSSGEWYVYGSQTSSVIITAWGLDSDVPLTADFNGNGRADYSVWRNGEWFVNYN